MGEIGASADITVGKLAVRCSDSGPGPVHEKAIYPTYPMPDIYLTTKPNAVVS